jgi:mono/diheme cytochrome c family protein
MYSMRKTLWCGLVVLLFGATAVAAESNVEYGRYLVENLGGCVDCHTPQLPNGEYDKTHWLKGAMLSFQPIHPIPHWKAASPDITPSGPKWKKWGEAGFVKFLETAAWPDGDKADPPMPPFRLNAHDARAIVDYLKTLK